MTKFLQRSPARAALVAALTLAASWPAAAQDTRQPAKLPALTNSAIDIPKVAVTEFTLRNGLRVVLHEDHSSPIVAVELWYNAGGKYDPKGKSGLAHMFEHMLDEGTANLPKGEFSRTIQSVGGYYNAETSNDFVRYKMVVPSNNLELALWLEAERMANTMPSRNEARFLREREAVKNEYRDRFGLSAVGAGQLAIPEALFPGGAYAPPVVGYMPELESTTVEDLETFYKTYYVPNNAVMVIVGDVNPADARRMVEKHLGPIPRGRPVVKPAATGSFSGETRLAIEHASTVRQLWMVWRGVPTASPERPAMMALSSILSQRLRRLLIDERKLSTFLNPNTNAHYDLQDAGIFQVAVTPTPTAPATTIEELVDSVVATIRTSGVTGTEVRRWAAGYRLQMLTSMQTDSAKAGVLGDATINTGQPLAYYDVVTRAQRVTPAEVQAAARKYLTPDRVVLSIVPTGKLDLVSKPNLPYTNVTRK